MTSHLKRLYSTRIAPVALRHDYLAEPYANVSRGLRRTYLQRLAGYVAEHNTQTYDHIYYFVKMPDVVGRLMSNHAWLLHCYAPYLEPEIASSRVQTAQEHAILQFVSSSDDDSLRAGSGANSHDRGRNVCVFGPGGIAGIWAST